MRLLWARWTSFCLRADALAAEHSEGAGLDPVRRPPEVEAAWPLLGWSGALWDDFEKRKRALALPLAVRG